MQRLGDQSVRDVRPVVPGRIDQVHAELDRAAQHRVRSRRIRRVAPHLRAGEPHRTESEPANLEVAEREGRRTNREPKHAPTLPDREQCGYGRAMISRNANVIGARA